MDEKQPVKNDLMPRSHDWLQSRLGHLDGQGYGAYKSLKGHYQLPECSLQIDRVQGDPFAAPSRIRVVVPQAIAQFPESLYSLPIRRIALEDYLLRQIHRHLGRHFTRRGSGKSGLIAAAVPSQAVLARTAVRVTGAGVTAQLAVGLPAFGRRIAGQQAISLLCQDVPALAKEALHYLRLDADAIAAHCRVVEDAVWLQEELRRRRLVAFVADGAILPRQSGIDDRPLADGAIPFQSPESLQVSVTLPSGDRITGMGIPEGITLIVGGGYHGKSTLLRALEAGVFPHIPGDGREFVVAEGTAMKVRAEDGRSVAGVDISPFINRLPQGKSTQCFSTADASGSTSQAASVIEAVEAGARVLLMDEDTSATNFMIRDRRMQALITKAQEPITPFVDKVQQLYQDHGVSTVLVMGGSGDYFEAADTVIAMDTYCPKDVTDAASSIAQADATGRQMEGGTAFGPITPRVISPEGLDPRKGKRSVSLGVALPRRIQFGVHTIDLSAAEQIVEPGQLKAISAAILYARQHYLDGVKPLPSILDGVMADLQSGSLSCLEEFWMGELSAFRRLELAAALNRFRLLEVDCAGPAHF